MCQLVVPDVRSVLGFQGVIVYIACLGQTYWWSWDARPSAHRSCFSPLTSLPCRCRQCFTVKFGGRSPPHLMWEIVTQGPGGSGSPGVARRRCAAFPGTLVGVWGVDRGGVQKVGCQKIVLVPRVPFSCGPAWLPEGDDLSKGVGKGWGGGGSASMHYNAGYAHVGTHTWVWSL